MVVVVAVERNEMLETSVVITPRTSVVVKYTMEVYMVVSVPVVWV
jgi:hypothetical protein